MKSPTIVGVAVGFAIAALLFGGLELAVRKGWISTRAADHPRRKRTKRELVQDIGYWLVTPLVTRVVTRFAIGLVLVLLAFRFGRGEAGIRAMLEHIQARSPLHRLPFAVQLLLGLSLGDAIGYATHRMFHRARWLWPFHAVHHSSVKLDWLASTRLHPVNDSVSKLALTIPLVLLGFDTTVFATVAPVLTAYAVFIHADVPWDFGPLRYVIATPRFHRWHHTSEREGRDKNFAGLFPIWDLMFGTFYMPAHEPTVFGVERPVPIGILAQLAWPFRSRARAATSVAKSDAPYTAGSESPERMS